VLTSFVKGVVKVFGSLLFGAGTSFMAVAYFAMQDRVAWDFHSREPPPVGELFFSIGLGCIAAAALMGLLFAFPSRQLAGGA
jgi:hypothetical protein